MIFLSAGHHFNPAGNDPGAVNAALGITEAALTRELRNLICTELDKIGARYITDRDSETLPQYLQRIKPGSGSVVCELHFNSSINLATGAEVIVSNNANDHERRLATELCNALVAETRLLNRGVKTEAQSHRGRLAILHTAAGISVLPELCFINNPRDVQVYQAARNMIAWRIASLLKKYDDLQ